jgi:hypothetical protein
VGESGGDEEEASGEGTLKVTACGRVQPRAAAAVAAIAATADCNAIEDAVSGRSAAAGAASVANTTTATTLMTPAVMTLTVGMTSPCL